MRPARAFLAAVAVAAGVMPFSAQAATVPPDGVLSFQVIREGSPIGTHELRFSVRDGGTAVDIETDVAVKLAFITVYRFEHEGHELWRDGHLVSLNSTTNDDGTDHRLEVKAQGGELAVDGDANQARLPQETIPASLWNMDLVEQSQLLNTLDGSLMSVSIREVGPETVSAGGEEIAATHYVIEGDLEREVWYSDEGLLVRVRFKGSDGSEIVYRLR